MGVLANGLVGMLGRLRKRLVKADGVEVADVGGSDRAGRMRVGAGEVVGGGRIVRHD